MSPQLQERFESFIFKYFVKKYRAEELEQHGCFNNYIVVSRARARANVRSLWWNSMLRAYGTHKQIKAYQRAKLDAK